ncbi:hypothetical protein BPAE_0030g00560 [Botrytis paeoniae]|uniref:Uncharacterized protein n=1 Tax=Botrytis paeoniae TaxID=278948 RepID=A0A4Z1FYA3_9HELO|nr:hypothetical protein BPAE_0030g00560 [Botrytis paeoniae]
MTGLVHNGLLSVGCQLVPKQYECEPVQGWKAHDFFVILIPDGCHLLKICFELPRKKLSGDR